MMLRDIRVVCINLKRVNPLKRDICLIVLNVKELSRRKYKPLKGVLQSSPLDQVKTKCLIIILSLSLQFLEVE